MLACCCCSCAVQCTHRNGLLARVHGHKSTPLAGVCAALTEHVDVFNLHQTNQPGRHACNKASINTSGWHPQHSRNVSLARRTAADERQESPTTGRQAAAVWRGNAAGGGGYMPTGRPPGVTCMQGGPYLPVSAEQLLQLLLCCARGRARKEQLPVVLRAGTRLDVLVAAGVTHLCDQARGTTAARQ